jgi:hypothetical protein
MIDTRSDGKVLIDLNRVSRIDSAGLGMLMRCTHAVKQSGALKLLQPAQQVKKVLSLTKIDSVILCSTRNQRLCIVFNRNSDYSRWRSRAGVVIVRQQKHDAQRTSGSDTTSRNDLKGIYRNHYGVVSGDQREGSNTAHYYD